MNESIESTGIEEESSNQQRYTQALDALKEMGVQSGQGDVSEPFYNALTLLPEVAREWLKSDQETIKESNSNPDISAVGTRLRSQKELRDLYLTAVKAVAKQGDSPQNQTVQLIAAHGIVDQTSKLVEIGAYAKNIHKY